MGNGESYRRVLRREYQISVELPDRAEFMSDPRRGFEDEFLQQISPDYR